MPDLLTLIKEDHHVMMTLMETLCSGGEVEGEEKAVKLDIVQMLAQIFAFNMTFKDEVLYPAVRRATADGYATSATEDHCRLNEMIAELQDLAPNSGRWPKLLEALQQELANRLTRDEQLLDRPTPLFQPDEAREMAEEYARRREC